MSGPEEMSRDELLVVVARQAGRLEAQDRQIAEMAGRLGELMEANEALAAQLARLEHLLSRNSGNSSSPPSRDEDPGKPRGGSIVDLLANLKDQKAMFEFALDGETDLHTRARCDLATTASILAPEPCKSTASCRTTRGCSFPARGFVFG